MLGVAEPVGRVHGTCQRTRANRLVLDPPAGQEQQKPGSVFPFLNLSELAALRLSAGSAESGGRT